MSDELKTSKRKRRFAIVVGMVAIFGLLQFARFIVPAFEISNPPVTHTVQWDSLRTQSLWEESCADCHSNQTVWPWYAYIAPVGWLVARDVHEGRDHINVSEGRIEGEEVAEVIWEGEMPPSIYLVIHTGARLDDAERRDLIAGLQATFGFSAGGEHDDDGGNDD